MTKETESLIGPEVIPSRFISSTNSMKRTNKRTQEKYDNKWERGGEGAFI